MLALWGMFVGVTLRFDEHDIQDALAMRVPQINEQLAQDGKHLKIEDVDVTVDEVMTARFALRGDVLGKDFFVASTATGVPRYAALEGAVYFDPSDFTIDEFQYGSQDVEHAIAGAAERYVTNLGARRFLTDNAARAAALVTSAAERTIEHALARTPYRIKHEGKGLIVMAFLQDIHIDHHDLVVRLTLMRLVWWVGMALFAALMSIGMMFTLSRYPNLGTAMVVLGGL
jgi:predicted phage tail protein